MLVKKKVSMKPLRQLFLSILLLEKSMLRLSVRGYYHLFYCFMKGVGGLYPNIINHFLFEIVNSKEIVSEILVSKPFNLFTIIFIINNPLRPPKLISISSKWRKLVAIYLKLMVKKTIIHLCFINAKNIK